MPEDKGKKIPRLAQAAEKRCFMITPIGSPDTPTRRHADWVFKFAVQPVFADAGYEAERADLIADPAMINDSVFEKLTSAEICVADLSFLNANVFYELGVRHAIERPVIHIAQKDTIIPFDTAGHRVIFFDLADIGSMESLKHALAAQIRSIEAPDFRISNPLTHARGRHNLVQSADPTGQLIADLLDRVAMLERRGNALQRPTLRPTLPSGNVLAGLLDQPGLSAQQAAIAVIARAAGKANGGPFEVPIDELNSLLVRTGDFIRPHEADTIIDAVLMNTMVQIENKEQVIKVIQSFTAEPA